MHQYNNEFSRETLFVETIKKSKNKLLGLSLFWFSLGVLITILFSGVIASIPLVYNNWSLFLQNNGLSPVTFIYSSIILEFIVCFIFQLFFGFKKVKKVQLVASIIAYFVYVIISTTSLTLLTLSLNSYSLLSISTAVLMFLIPAAMFIIIGILGYFNKVDFEKLNWIIYVGFLATFLIWILSFFTIFRNNKIWSLYLSIMMIVSMVIIGINFQTIKKYDMFLENTNNENNLETLNLSITFGFNLYILFVGLIWKVLFLLMKNN